MIKNNLKRNSVCIKPVQVNTSVSLFAGIDVGSTQTRVSLLTAEQKDSILTASISEAEALKLLKKIYIINSAGAYLEDEREIKPKGPELKFNYDSRVILLDCKSQDPMIRRLRVIRGNKIADTSGVVVNYFDSSTNKTDNRVFYVNCIDSLGYAIMRKFNGNIPTQVDISLCVSVRPRELNSFCRNKMTENLVGSYIFKWNDVEIHINITDLKFTTEPEAQIRGFICLADLSGTTDSYTCLVDATNSIHIEGGGSSIGVEVFKEGYIQDGCSSSFQFGGEYLERILADRINELKGRTPSAESVHEAVTTCLLRNGAQVDDIRDIVAECKNQIADNIYTNVMHNVLVKSSGLSLFDVEYISLGGRLFAEDAANNSISQFLSEKIKAESPNTEVLYLENNSIPIGNLVNAMGIDDEEIDIPDEAEPFVQEMPVTELTSSTPSKKSKSKGKVEPIPADHVVDADEPEEPEEAI